MHRRRADRQAIVQHLAAACSLAMVASMSCVIEFNRPTAAPGSEGGPCLAQNNGCNLGLSCLSAVCVRFDPRHLDLQTVGADLHRGSDGTAPPAADRPIAPASDLSTSCGSTYCVTTVAGLPSTPGYRDGPASQAQFTRPLGIAVDATGRVIIADSGNHCIRLFDGKNVVTIAGVPHTPGSDDGPAGGAKFYQPAAVAVGPAGEIYVADQNNHRIRKIAGGFVSTFAGGLYGFMDATAASARFSSPSGISVDSKGLVFVSDTGNQRIRLIAGGNVTTVSGTGERGFRDGAAMSALYNEPYATAVAASGVLLVSDRINNRIRQLNGSDVSTLAGQTLAGYSDGPLNVGRLDQPLGLAVLPSGDVLIADSKNHRVRLLHAGMLATVAGTAVAGHADGPGTSAQLNQPAGVAAASDRLFYVVDVDCHCVRMIAMHSSQ